MNVNPFIGAVLQTPQAQRQQVEAKAQQVRRAQELRRNIGVEGDQYTHAVESTEELKPVHKERDEAKQQKKRRPSNRQAPPADDETPHVDLTA